MRFFALALCQLLLWGIVGAVNFHLAPWHIYLLPAGLHVAYAALILPPGLAFGITFFAGLMLDAASPVPFGLHAWLFGAATITLFVARPRLARDEAAVQLGIALLVNFAVFVLLSATLLHDAPSPGVLLWRLLWDLLWTQIATALLSYWFSALQRRALELAAPAFLSERNGRL